MSTPDIRSNMGRLLAFIKFISWSWYPDADKTHQKGYSKYFLSKYGRFVCQVLYLSWFRVITDSQYISVQGRGSGGVPQLDDNIFLLWIIWTIWATHCKACSKWAPVVRYLCCRTHTSRCGARAWYSLIWLGAKTGISGLSSSVSTGWRDSCPL